MPKISDSNLYETDDLIRIWEHGWRSLANFAEELGFQRIAGFSDNSYSPGFRVLRCSEEIIRHITRDKNISFSGLPFHGVQALAAAPANKYDYISSYIKHLPIPHDCLGSQVDAERKLRKIMTKVTEAFATCKTFEGVLQKIAAPGNYERFIGANKEHHGSWTAYMKKLLEIRIEPPWGKVMRWLGKGLKSKEACEEAGWNCVWLVMQSKVDEMLEIKRRIDKNIPLTDSHISLLNEHMSYGHPVASYFLQDNESKTYQVLLRPNPCESSILTVQFFEAANILLVQPAFRLAQELQNKLSRPRFIRQCRAPSCGKIFYTGRKDATACPGSQGYKKNKCALEWNRYRRYLKKINRNPEKDWDNDKLKEQFISYDKS